MAKSPKMVEASLPLRWRIVQVDPREDHWLIQVRNESVFPASLSLTGITWTEKKGETLSGELKAISELFAQPFETVVLKFSLTQGGVPWLEASKLSLSYWTNNGSDPRAHVPYPKSISVELPSLEVNHG